MSDIAGGQEGSPIPEDASGEWTIGAFIDAATDLPPYARAALIDRLKRQDPAVLVQALFPDEPDPGRRTMALVQLQRMVDRRNAQQEFERMFAATPDIQKPMVLTEFLDEPDEDATYRVAKLWPTGGRVVLSAQYKAGKTTLAGNLIRSLADGVPFLDHFEVEAAGRIVLIDNELDPRMLRRWLRDHEITNCGAVGVLPLRGRLSSFDILDAATRTRWAAAVGPADVLIFDCLRPALDALGLSEDKDAGRFLEALDEFTAEAGISELLVVHHMGHSKERSRGDSRILDWPDAIWRLIREAADDPVSLRYLSAYGRDVDQPEVRLAYSDFGRRLRVDGGSRADSRAIDLQDEVLRHVRIDPGCTQTAIEQAVSGDRMDIRRAIRDLAQQQRITVEQKGRGHHHYPNDKR